MNIGSYCGALISTGKATLKELQEYYSLTDLFIMAEVLQVDNYNQGVINRKNSGHHSINLGTI
ncbi:hypothetical protein [Orbus mooreae]|uniref:hypothetical protein n=1 Tax=Orbus mooreae TaxID=3074107 RepID=UPI00370D9901